MIKRERSSEGCEEDGGGGGGALGLDFKAWFKRIDGPTGEWKFFFGEEGREAAPRESLHRLEFAPP